MEIPGEKLIMKLWDSIADKGIGSLLKPWQIKREGRASLELRREELLVIAQAEVDAADIVSGRKVLLTNGVLVEKKPEDLAVSLISNSKHLSSEHVIQVADANIRKKAIRQEVSLAKAILHAENELAQHPEEPSEQKISEDWLFRWRDYAADVSSDDLQALWGKVLAGEVKNPGSFSLRAMEFLRNLSADEAKAIEKLSPYVIGGIIFRGDETIFSSAGIVFANFLELQEMGIISGVGGLGLDITWKSQLGIRFQHGLISYNRGLLIKHEDPSKFVKVPIYQISSLGRQILRLGSFRANESYLKSLGSAIRDQGFDVFVGSSIRMGANDFGLMDLEPLTIDPVQ